jgi:hypothetical protein
VLGHRGGIGERLDLGEPARQRLDAVGVELRLIHAGDPEIRHDLLDAGGIGLRRHLLGDLLLHLQRALAQHVEGAPPRLVTRDGIRADPLRVGMRAEIGAGVHRRIEVVAAEADGLQQLALVQAICGLGRGGFFAGRLAATGQHQHHGGGCGQDGSWVRGRHGGAPQVPVVVQGRRPV